MKELTYDNDYFLNAFPNIKNNPNLREPQIDAYEAVEKHFVGELKTSSAIVVLPTGVGKTGLIGLLPYKVAKGRVLVITPQLVIKDAILDSLDPTYPDNFWLKRKVFSSPRELPTVIEYEGASTRQELLEIANLVILNIHKLQIRLESSLIKRVPPDFFDMIIIDEAHHSAADTWVDAVNYFSNAKVVKLTGTPYRTDKAPIVGELVYKYKLSSAMANGFVKTLENIEYIPNELMLTIDNDESKTYTVDEILSMGLKDDDWISRSVAYSDECSLKVVEKSIELLNGKLEKSSVPHKIIAVACSINHAEKIQQLYEQKGLKATIIHSRLEKSVISERLKDIENHRVQVVIHVAKLGEGYDHPYLSIAAIFRPFRSELPYAQFIGRILRVIPENEVKSPDDNIGQIVSHKHLGLEKLWNDYKQEIQESEIIKYLKELDDVDIEDDINLSDKHCSQDRSFGKAHEVGEGFLRSEPYLYTELIKEREKHLEEEKEKIAQLQKVLPNISESQARSLIYQAEGMSSVYKRPDLYIKRISKNIDQKIKEEIVPELIQKYGIKKDSDDLKRCRLFWSKFNWIPRKAKDNAALLAIYFLASLNDMIGKKKSEWSLKDFEIAESRLDELYEYVSKIIEDYLEKA